MLSQAVSRVGAIVQRGEAVVISAAILLIAFLTILNVFCRSLLGFSLAFAEEISQFCIIVVCFVGLSYAASQGRHIRMTAVYDQLPFRVRKALMTAITATTALLLLVMAWQAVRYVVAVYELGGIYPTLRVPLYVVYAIAPLGLGLAGIQYALATVKNLTDSRIYLSFDQVDDVADSVSQEG